MYDSNSKGISYTAGFFILIGFVVAGLLVAGLISLPVWTGMTGTSFEKMSEGMNDPANAGAFKVIQCITAIVGFFFPALLTAYLLNRKPLKLLGYATPHVKMNQAAVVLLIMFIGLFVSTGLSYFNSHIPIPDSWRNAFDKAENEYNSQVVAILGLNSVGEYLLALFVMAFLPALCEETLFRGGLQNFLTRATKMPWLSIFIVSILFSAAHWSYYGFLSRFFLGVLLGLIYQYSGKLWLNILGHFLNNAIAITVIYVYTLQGKSLETAMKDDADTYYGVFALPVVILLLVWFWKISKKDKEELEAAPMVENNPNDILPS